MKSTLRRAAGAAACALALTALATPGAQAETQKHKDPKGDVEPADISGRQQAPKPGIDIISSTNTYQGGTVTMTLKTVNLVKDDYFAVWYLDTADTTYSLFYSRLGGQAEIQFTEVAQMPRLGHPSEGVAPVCEGFSVKPQPKKDKIVGKVPRSCIDGANSVRIGAGLVREGPQMFTADDARRTGYQEGLPKLGPKLRRN